MSSSLLTTYCPWWGYSTWYCGRHSIWGYGWYAGRYNQRALDRGSVEALLFKYGNALKRGIVRGTAADVREDARFFTDVAAVFAKNPIEAAAILLDSDLATFGSEGGAEESKEAAVKGETKTPTFNAFFMEALYIASYVCNRLSEARLQAAVDEAVRKVLKEVGEIDEAERKVCEAAGKPVPTVGYQPSSEMEEITLMQEAIEDLRDVQGRALTKALSCATTVRDVGDMTEGLVAPGRVPGEMVATPERVVKDGRYTWRRKVVVVGIPKAHKDMVYRRLVELATSAADRKWFEWVDNAEPRAMYRVCKWFWPKVLSATAELLRTKPKELMRGLTLRATRIEVEEMGERAAALRNEAAVKHAWKRRGTYVKPVVAKTKVERAARATARKKKLKMKRAKQRIKMQRRLALGKTQSAEELLRDVETASFMLAQEAKEKVKRGLLSQEELVEHETAFRARRDAMRKQVADYVETREIELSASNKRRCAHTTKSHRLHHGLSSLKLQKVRLECAVANVDVMEDNGARRDRIALELDEVNEEIAALREGGEAETIVKTKKKRTVVRTMPRQLDVDLAAFTQIVLSKAGHTMGEPKARAKTRKETAQKRGEAESAKARKVKLSTRAATLESELLVESENDVVMAKLFALLLASKAKVGRGAVFAFVSRVPVFRDHIDILHAHRMYNAVKAASREPSRGVATLVSHSERIKHKFSRRAHALDTNIAAAARLDKAENEMRDEVIGLFLKIQGVPDRHVFPIDSVAITATGEPLVQCMDADRMFGDTPISIRFTDAVKKHVAKLRNHNRLAMACYIVDTSSASGAAVSASEDGEEEKGTEDGAAVSAAAGTTTAEGVWPAKPDIKVKTEGGIELHVVALIVGGADVSRCTMPSSINMFTLMQRETPFGTFVDDQSLQVMLRRKPKVQELPLSADRQATLWRQRTPVQKLMSLRNTALGDEDVMVIAQDTDGLADMASEARWTAKEMMKLATGITVCPLPNGVNLQMMEPARVLNFAERSMPAMAYLSRNTAIAIAQLSALPTAKALDGQAIIGFKARAPTPIEIARGNKKTRKVVKAYGVRGGSHVSRKQQKVGASVLANVTHAMSRPGRFESAKKALTIVLQGRARYNKFVGDLHEERHGLALRKAQAAATEASVRIQVDMMDWTGCSDNPFRSLSAHSMVHAKAPYTYAPCIAFNMRCKGFNGSSVEDPNTCAVFAVIANSLLKRENAKVADFAGLILSSYYRTPVHMFVFKLTEMPVIRASRRPFSDIEVIGAKVVALGAEIATLDREMESVAADVKKKIRSLHMKMNTKKHELNVAHMNVDVLTYLQKSGAREGDPFLTPEFFRTVGKPWRCIDDAIALSTAEVLCSWSSHYPPWFTFNIGGESYRGDDGSTLSDVGGIQARIGPLVIWPAIAKKWETLLKTSKAKRRAWRRIARSSARAAKRREREIATRYLHQAEKAVEVEARAAAAVGADGIRVYDAPPPKTKKARDAERRAAARVGKGKGWGLEAAALGKGWGEAGEGGW